MTLVCEVLVSFFAALGMTFLWRELKQRLFAKKQSFVCICFGSYREWEEKAPDMLVICKNDFEQEEIIRRVFKNEKRDVFIKRW